MPPAATTPGIASKAASQLLLQEQRVVRVVPGARKIHFECEDTVGTEPEVYPLQAIVARQQHARANQQCQRERELSGRQHVAKLSPCPRVSGAGLLTKRSDGRDATQNASRARRHTRLPWPP